MDKAYKSKSYSSFLSAGKDYQKSQQAGNTSMGKDPKGTMEDMGFKQAPGIGKKIMDKMKYAPKTVSYDEFTSTKRHAKMQSMIGSNKDESTTKNMEKPSMSKGPTHMTASKHFDVDVTKYSPRKAKSSGDAGSPVNFSPKRKK